MSQKKQPVPVHKIKTKVMHDAGFDIISLDTTIKGRSYDASTFHRHTFYELFYFTRTGGAHEIDFRRFDVKAHAVHFVSPGQIHQLTLKGGDGFVICFTEEFFSLPGPQMLSEQFPFFDNPVEPVLELDKESSSVLQQQIQMLLMAHRNQQVLSNEIVRTYLHLILLGLKQFAFSQNSISTEHGVRNIVAEFRRLVNNNYLNNFSIGDYASTLNITPNYLNSLCRNETGKTATQQISDRILLEAKRLLYSTDLSVKEVAFELNFDNTAYFNRFFKKQCGQTPAEYREQIAKNR